MKGFTNESHSVPLTCPTPLPCAHPSARAGVCWKGSGAREGVRASSEIPLPSPFPGVLSVGAEHSSAGDTGR